MHEKLKKFKSQEDVKHKKNIISNTPESQKVFSQDTQFSSQSNLVQTKIITWAIVGGILGTLVGMLSSPTATISGTILGLLLGGALGLLHSLRYKEKNRQSSIFKNQTFSLINKPSLKPLVGQSKLQLKEEQLEISKRLIQTGQVNIHKEINQQERNITVPVICEELVVEKEDLYSKEKETIRIPLSEERIEVIKHPNIINDISIYTKKFQENIPVTEKLKKEKIKLEVKGRPKIKKQ